jgi:acyl-CoA reductase-like NAD-dependent aldehyde dehydrogenase
MTASSDLPEHRFFLAGEWQSGRATTIACPYDGAPVGVVHSAGAADLEQATQAAEAAFAQTKRLAGHRRAAVLRGVAGTITRRSEELARTLALEAGKPIRQARAEVARSVTTFATAAEEATRLRDELLHMDAVPGGEGRTGLVRRFPIGPVAAITPFNFPLNLVAHKLAPAIAAGCPVVLKPAPQTPISALLLAAIVAEAGWPAGALSVLPLDTADAAPLVEDERFAMLTFTGSPSVGWPMKARAGRKRVTLELGGNAGVVVHSDAEIEQAAERCAAGGFSYAGQSCISVQRIFVHAPVYQQFLDAFLPRVRALKLGHPLDETADLSSLIRASDGERVRLWLEEARAAGAECLLGGQIAGALVPPTVLVKAGPQLKVNQLEVFAPLVTVQPYDDFEAALEAVNDSAYGLQAGLFTRDVGRIFRAFEVLEVGGLIVGDVPTWRLDPMPYGGVKLSGFGREGLRYAIEEMTEPRLLVLKTEG